MAFISALPVSLHGAPSPALALSRSRTPAFRPRAPRAARGPRMSLPLLPVAANPAFLDSIAAAFQTLGMPPALVKYGHPAMMATMVAAMGVPGAAFGWLGRVNPDKKAGLAQKRTHENVMLAFTLLAALGGLGGTLSVAMQGYDVWTSPHALSAGVLLAALVANAVYAYTGFSIGTDGSPKARLMGRTIHAWLGVGAMSAFLIHAYLGYLLTQ